MFRREYQGGPYVEVFSAQGSDPACQWKLTGSVKKEYDKTVRGNVYFLDGGSSTTTTRMQLPKSDKNSLGLFQPWCVFQLLVPESAKVAIELSILDASGSRRRIQLSSSQKDVNATPLSARIPLINLNINQWVHLCIGVASLVEVLFKGSQFKSIEGVSLGGTLKLRRIFSLLNSPSDEIGLTAIPRTFHIGSVSIKTQIVNSDTLYCSTIDNDRESSDLKPTHIAFGKKVPIPDHILGSRQLQSRLDGETLSSVQPHPPSSSPVKQSLVRIRRTRVHIVSEKSSRKFQVHQSKSNAPKQTNSDEAVLKPSEQSGAIELSSVAKTVTDTRYKQIQASGQDRSTPEEQTYSYRSAPKSAKGSLFTDNALEGNSRARGARLEEDFLSSSHKYAEMSLADTRLSDDYDWRQYSSAQDSFHDDESLRTRLANRQPGSTHTSSHPDTISNAFEDTLSESMTLSGLAQHLHDDTHKSLLDSSDTGAMGGLLSPVLLDTGTDSVDQLDHKGDYLSSKPEEIELMYDPQLNCFFDPVTCKYYELRQSD